MLSTCANSYRFMLPFRTNTSTTSRFELTSLFMIWEAFDDQTGKWGLPPLGIKSVQVGVKSPPPRSRRESVRVRARGQFQRWKSLLSTFETGRGFAARGSSSENDKFQHGFPRVPSWRDFPPAWNSSINLNVPESDRRWRRSFVHMVGVGRSYTCPRSPDRGQMCSRVLTVVYSP